MARSRKLPKVLTRDEQTALLEQLPPDSPLSYRHLCMVRLMLDAGLRVGEVVALKPEHLNLQTGKLIVRAGKGNKDREVWLSAELLTLIRVWLEAHPQTRWLFPTSRGTMVAPRYVRKIVKQVAERAAVQEWQKVSPHTMRHTFATDFLNATGNIILLQEILGHSNVSTTMIYTHINSTQVQLAMQSFTHGR